MYTTYYYRILTASEIPQALLLFVCLAQALFIEHEGFSGLIHWSIINFTIKMMDKEGRHIKKLSKVYFDVGMLKF